MSKRAPYLYVVELFEDGAWQTTCGVARTREAARFEIRRWRKGNPYDKFRLRRYVREVI